jgi:capsule assembly protein Wzi
MIYSQVGYIPVDDEIYSFLDRMNTISVISDYNSFELPKTRKNIKEYLITIVDSIDQLDRVDKNKLDDFLIEFEIDLATTFKKSESLIPQFNFEYLISEREKYLYSYYDLEGNSVFINFIGKLDNLNQSIINSDINSNSLLYRFGGELRGTLFDKIGFSLKTTNGSFIGDKSLAQSYSSLKYNYKFHRENEDNTGDNYFDESSSFLAYENNFAKIKIGNDRKLIGHGSNKILLSDNAPKMDYVSLDLKYKALEFSFFHGKILGNQFIQNDSIQGGINLVSDKYLAYHRFGLNFSKHLNIGLGEMIVYANRNVDFSYLNPFNFYKSAEHANQDRDNTFLFLDVQNNSVDGLKIYSTVLIDDIDFGKVGQGWYGNQSLISIGAYSSQLYHILPLDFEFQFIKIDPYVYTHRINDNNFTNSNFGLGSTLQPNSSSTSFNVYYRPHHRVSVNAGYSYTLHGNNSEDLNGNLLTNYGGDILIGHRQEDSEEVYFLNGEIEIFRNYKLESVIEPIKNWIFSLTVNYYNNSLAKSQHSEELFTTFSFSTKL